MKLIPIVVVFFSGWAALAQHDTEVTASVPGEDGTLRSAYIKGYPDDFFVWPVLKQRRLDFDMRTLGDDHRLSYKSNKPYSVGLGMYVFELGVEFTFSVPLNEQNKRIFGESRARDLQLNILGKRWGVDLYHQRYNGFYLEDSQVKVPAGMPYPQRPDIGTRNVGMTVNYIFNKERFSFRSPYNFSERQLRSGGSFVIFGSLRSFRALADSAIAGPDYLESFGQASTIRKVDVTLVGAAPGYTYNLVYRGFFLNGTLALGPGYNWITHHQENGNEAHRNDVSVMVAARIALGYNGDRIFGGLAFWNQGGRTTFDNVELTNSNSSFKILMGYRFRESGVLKKRIWDLPAAIFR